MSSSVSFSELICKDGQHRIGVATLCNEPSLNALTYNMLDKLYTQLRIWQEDAGVACVFLEGEGEKAFCAGGDVRTMHDVMRDSTDEEIIAFCTRYFTLEYECDYLIHTFGKPLIAWGDGIVMGGGIGLYAGASHRIVTPSSRLAMPEVSIGLYPDVGGTWFLNRITRGVGLFLGLTAAQLNGTDAVEVNLADYQLSRDQKWELLEKLESVNWQEEYSDRRGEGSRGNFSHRVSELISELADNAGCEKPESVLLSHLDAIQSACEGDDINLIYQNILDIPGESNWLMRAKENMREGSAISVHICFRQINRYHSLSLAECLKLELIISVRCGLLGEFQEGVRARLVDKDGKPEWKYKDPQSVDPKVIDTLFTSLWSEQEHPLAQLGEVKAGD